MGFLRGERFFGANLTDFYSRLLHFFVSEVRFLTLVQSNFNGAVCESIKNACCLVLTKKYFFFDLLVCWFWELLWQDEAVQQVVDVLEEYSLDQEDMDTIVDMSVLKV